MLPFGMSANMPEEKSGVLNRNQIFIKLKGVRQNETIFAKSYLKTVVEPLN